MSGPAWKVVWTLCLAMCAVLRVSAQSGAPTCDPRPLDADSYALTATLYVDVKSYFVLAFDRVALKVYRYGELAGPFEKTMGMPKFVGADRERFWRALGGCIDPEARPEAVVPWTEVREIRGGNWVLWFKLDQRVAIASETGRRKSVDEIKVNLHWRDRDGGPLRHARPRGPAHTSIMGPFDYNQRLRYTIAKHVEPRSTHQAAQGVEICWLVASHAVTRS